MLRAPPPGWNPRPRKPLATLASAIRMGLVVVVLLALFGAVVEWYGIAAVIGYVDGSRSFESLVTYDDLSLVWWLLHLPAVLVTGILWMVWQSRAAANAGPELLRRSPEMHAWSWVIPIISYWFPYQNISDLHRAAGVRTPGRGVWWALWRASSCWWPPRRSHGRSSRVSRRRWMRDRQGGDSVATVPKRVCAPRYRTASGLLVVHE